jgi:hypothetical protein
MTKPPFWVTQLRYGLIAFLLLAACASLTQRDLRTEYLEQTRAIGMTPVYPPRGEVQVGDVYLTFVPANGGDDAATSLFVGRMNSLRDQALAYLASRDNVGGLMPKDGGQVQIGEMRELPAVNFPTITGSAASSASLGAIAPVFSGLFAVGSSDTVSMKFVDVRAFGMPYLAASVSASDFQRNVCPVLLGKVSALYGELGYNAGDPDAGPPPCGDPKAAALGQSCRIQLITRTYLTREIAFKYNQKRKVGASFATATPLGVATPMATPPSISVNIDGNTAPETATSVITALKTPTTASAQSVAAATVTETAQGLEFEQNFQDPLAIAYEAVSLSLIDADRLCPLTK